MKIPASFYTLLFIPLAILGFTACEDTPEVAYAGGNSFGYQGQGPSPSTTPQYGAPYGQSASPNSETHRVPSNPTADSDAPNAKKEKKEKGPSRDSTAEAGNSSPANTTPPAGPGGTPSYPKGIPVPNKPGFVTSPYTKADQGYVDVRGYPPGMEVKDPYTGGVFLVP